MLEFAILKDAGVPENIPSQEDIQPGGELTDIVVDGLGNLTAVAELDGEEIEVPTVESMDIAIEALVDDESANAVASNSVRKALQKLQKATGLNFDQPQPKPPPSIMIEEGVCRAFLQGCCYLTLAPLMHLLANAREDDKFAIELDSPYLGPNDIISLATAIEHSNANVYVGVRRIRSMYIMMLLDVADEIHIAPNVHSIGTMTSFAMGSSLDMETTSLAFSEHVEYVHQLLVARKFITDDELSEIAEKGRSINFTTEELLSRLNGSEMD